MRLRYLFRVIVGAVLLTALSVPSYAERVHRSIFYNDTPFGSLAWVKGSVTRASARSKLTVEDLSSKTCINLPATGVQWFMINHSDADLDGQTGYFSVRILYNFGPEERLPEDEIGIHLQRNGNWFDASGAQVVAEYERNSDQIALTDQTFIDLHEPSEEKVTERLEELQKAVGPWHMKPTGNSESTWSDRYLYGPMLRAYLSQSAVAISARMIRFTSTASTWSTSPVVFWLDPRGAKAATILVDAPRHTYSASSRVYAVKFGGTCP
jgi:hypothetical protein